MATYKVIQDIEAEDKLVGPLTLRQFIYGAIAAFCGYLSFVAVMHGFSLALIVLSPPMLFTGFFAFPWGRDQPTEVWALAKIRFFLKSRRRIWDQSGAKELVNITVPKREIKQYTNGLSVNEVQSRLSALATTLDTRGWAVKNVYSAPSLMGRNQSADRLLDISLMPREVPSVDVSVNDDILDEQNNPRALQLQQMVVAATASHKQQLMEEMRRGTIPAPAPAAQTPKSAPQNDYWFLQKPSAPTMEQPLANMQSPAQASGQAWNDTQLAELLHERQAEASVPDEHLKTIMPLSAPASPRPQAVPAAPAPVTPTPDPATMRLAYNNDLNIATIAREANKGKDSGEVVISLHKRD